MLLSCRFQAPTPKPAEYEGRLCTRCGGHTPTPMCIRKSIVGGASKAVARSILPSLRALVRFGMVYPSSSRCVSSRFQLMLRFCLHFFCTHTGHQHCVKVLTLAGGGGVAPYPAGIQSQDCIPLRRVSEHRPGRMRPPLQVILVKLKIRLIAAGRSNE